MKKSIQILKALILIIFFILPSVSCAQSGSLDLTFDNDGKVTTAIGTDRLQARAVAIQSDGKIIMAGRHRTGIYWSFITVRYNTNGSIDSTFGTYGIVITFIGTSNSEASSIAVQSDGKIVVAGYCYNGTKQDFALIRYNTDGSIDTTFDNDGKVTTSFGNLNDAAFAMAIQSDGKILVTGTTDLNGLKSNFALARYNTNGSLDTTFDNDGKVITIFSAGNDSGLSITLQPDGKIVVAGQATQVTQAFALARYNINGSLDTSFDTDGKVTTVIGTMGNCVRSVIIQPDGKIVAAGHSSNGVNAAVLTLTRYNTNGSLDSSFGSYGKVTTTGGYVAHSVILQPDGKIVVAGSICYYMGGYDFSLVRYNTNGSLDLTFDNDGIVTTSFTNTLSYGVAAAIQADGKIVLAGFLENNSNGSFALARYNNYISLGTTNTISTSPEMRIYSNPFAKSAVIYTDDYLKNASLTFYNIYGQKVKQLNNITGNAILLDRDNLLSGLYFIQLSQGNKSISRTEVVITD